MPEIPEVEAFKAYITRTSLRKKIADVVAGDKRLIKGSFTSLKKALVAHTLTKVERKGKYLIISISSEDKKLVMHFGLTGSVNYRKDATNQPSYARVAFLFADGAALFFIDTRKFGKLWLVDDISDIKGLASMGPDALKITQKQFVAMLAAHARKNIKTVLMDQDAISGIGNEYSDEILFQSGIDPRHHVKDLSAAQIKKLYTTMKKVLKYAIKIRTKQMKHLKAGTVYSNLANEDFASSYLQAHRHTDKKCPKHHEHMLKTTKIGGRTAYYCPKDQQ